MTEQELELLKEEIKQEIEEENQDSIDEEELIYHRMGPTFYLSRGNEGQ